MRLIDADKLKRHAQKIATEAWKTRNTAKVETVLNQFIDWISEAPSVAVWTSVKNGLPEKNGRYIVFSESPICKSMLFANFAKDLQKIDRNAFYEMKRPGWYEYDSEWGYCELNYVTHWMPLPKMPEGESE